MPARPIHSSQSFLAAWSPAPAEIEYYEQLYRTAVPDGGEIAGGAAVAFFTKSGLPKSSLKEIWTAANLRNGPSLNKREFFIAMKLTALAQAQKPITRDSVVSPTAGFAFPAFAGIPVPAAPSVAHVGAAAAPLAGSMGFVGAADTSASPYFIARDDQEKYDRVFASTDSDGDGYVQGGQAAELFGKSGLDRVALKQIWTLADIDKDGRLDKDEFSVAMHLVVGSSKRGVPIPPTLPSELIPASRRAMVGLPPLAAAQPAIMAAPPAPVPAPAPVPFVPAKIDDAFGAIAPEPAPTPAPVPAPAPAPAAVPVQAVPTPTNASSTGAGAMAARKPSFTGGLPPAHPAAASAPVSLPGGMGSHHASAGWGSAAPAPASAAVHYAPAPVPASGTAHLSTEDVASMVRPLAAAAAEVESAMSGQVRRENVSLEAKRALTEAAHAELRRLEQEKSVFVGQIDRLRATAEAEDKEYADIMAKAQAIRAEIVQLRSVDAQSQQGVAARKQRNGEAKGVLATLAAQLVAAGGRKDALSAESLALLEGIVGKEVLVAQLQGQVQEVQGIAATHMAVAEVNEEETAALQSALVSTQARIAELQSTVASLQARAQAAGVNVEQWKAKLAAAEQQTASARARHEQRCVQVHSLCVSAPLDVSVHSYLTFLPFSTCSLTTKMQAKAALQQANSTLHTLGETASGLSSSLSGFPQTTSAAAVPVHHAPSLSAPVTMSSRPVAPDTAFAHALPAHNSAPAAVSSSFEHAAPVNQARRPLAEQEDEDSEEELAFGRGKSIAAAAVDVPAKARAASGGAADDFAAASTYATLEEEQPEPITSGFEASDGGPDLSFGAALMPVAPAPAPVAQVSDAWGDDAFAAVPAPAPVAPASVAMDASFGFDASPAPASAAVADLDFGMPSTQSMASADAWDGGDAFAAVGASPAAAAVADFGDDAFGAIPSASVPAPAPAPAPAPVVAAPHAAVEDFGDDAFSSFDMSNGAAALPSAPAPAAAAASGSLADEDDPFAAAGFATSAGFPPAAASGSTGGKTGADAFGDSWNF